MVTNRNTIFLRGPASALGESVVVLQIDSQGWTMIWVWAQEKETIEHYKSEVPGVRGNNIRVSARKWKMSNGALREWDMRYLVLHCRTCEIIVRYQEPGYEPQFKWAVGHRLIGKLTSSNKVCSRSRNTSTKNWQHIHWQQNLSYFVQFCM